MLSTYNQENLTTQHATTAASKPLNQSLRSLQPRTPGLQSSKTPFRARNDKNQQFNTVKAGKILSDAFQTPAPQKRAPLGARTTNAKTQAFRTPLPSSKPVFVQETVNGRTSSIRQRSAKKKIHVASEIIAQSTTKYEEDTEPEYDSAPPNPIPLPDPPIDFNYDQSFSWARPENFNRGVSEIYLQSPRNDAGVSLRLLEEEKVQRRLLEEELEQILKEDIQKQIIDSDDEEEVVLQDKIKPKKTQVPQEARNSTLKSRQASNALSQLTSEPPTRTAVRPRLPLAASRETTSSKMKRKSTWTVARDHDVNSRMTSVSKSTIGFPKARQAPTVKNLFQQPQHRERGARQLPSAIVEHDYNANVVNSEISGEEEINVDEELQFKINGLNCDEDFEL